MPIATRKSRLILVTGAGALALTGLLAANTPPQEPSGAPRPFRRAVRQLGLSEDQQTQIRGILKGHAGEIEAHMRAAQSGHKALREAMAVQPLDEARIRQQALALGEVRADGAVLRARIRSEIWPILTPDQQEKAKEMRSMKGRREKRRMENLERWLEGGA